MRKASLCAPMLLLLAWLAGWWFQARCSAPPIAAGWEAGLARYVNARGEVNYTGWRNDRSGLDSYLRAVSGISTQDYGRMSRQDKLADWINVYNAFTCRVVLDHYPIHRSGLNFYPDSSIRQIDGAWDKYRISTAGRTVNLSEIENKVLRGEFKEPLIHFAINCASKSCPKLLNTAYTGATLQKELEAQAAAFIRDPSRNKFDVQRQKVELSKIFDWFGDDFKDSYGAKPLAGRSEKESAVLNFVSRYLEGEQKQLVLSNKFSLGYLPYDWSLNEQRAVK